MYKPLFLKRDVFRFRHFSRKGYALFACLGRTVVISVLSAATLSAAKAASISDETFRVDSTKATKEVWLGDVGVTGSRAPLTLSQAARMVSVLDRDDIQAAPVQSVNDLLKYAVGVDVRQRGALGSQTDISIRGGTQEQITILLNGINICDPQTGHNVMDLPVDLSEIVRIEVLEGPAGRTYGTSSLVGAINIVTRPALQSGANARFEGGSFGYVSAGARANLKQGRWNNQMSGSVMRSDGFSRSQAGTLNNDYEGYKAFYQGEYDDDHVRVAWHLGMTDKGWGSSTFYASPRWQADDQYEHTLKLFSAVQAETKQGVLHFRPSIYWNQNNDRYEGYRGKPETMKFNYNRCDVYGVGLSSYFDWTGGRTAFGAEIRNEDLVSGNLGEPLFRAHKIKGTDREYTLGINRTNVSAHLEHNLLLSNLTVSAGFVAMKSSQSSMNMTLYPGIDLSYRIGPTWKVFASYNSSFRLPSFTEMYYKLQGYAADPHLKPEEMTALEAGFQYASSILKAKASVYHHHGKNMIDWIMDTSLQDNAVWQSVNHTKINSFGVETSLGCNLKELFPRQDVLQSAGLSYSYINQDKDLERHIVSQYALEYLKHQLAANMKLHLIERLHLTLNWRWKDRVGSYTDFSGKVCDYKPFALLDAKLSWAEPSYSIYADLNNVFNKTDYVDYGNVKQPGFWLIIGAKFHFNF